MLPAVSDLPDRDRRASAHPSSSRAPLIDGTVPGMTETTTDAATTEDRPNERPIEVKVYVETREQAAWAGDHAPPPLPNKLAREQMSRILRNEGYALVGQSVKEVLPRLRVVVDDSPEGYHACEERETPTGHVCVFTGHGVLSAGGSDSAVPTVTVVLNEETGAYVADLPTIITERGGDVRIRHDLDTDEVTIYCRRPSGERVPYMIASDLDGQVVHISGVDRGATSVLLTRDAPKPPRPRQPEQPMIH